MFVDEFQDTSSEQIAALRLFRDKLGFRLVAVGDSKQSIYGFRNASPKAFEEMKNHDGHRWEDDLHISINRRSTNELIQFTNRACEVIHSISGIELFSKENAALSGVKNESSRIEIKALETADTEEEAISDFADQLHSLWEKEPDLFQNAAILVRNNRLVRAVTSQINSKGVIQAEAVNDDSGGDFYAQPVVLDLYFLLAALTHPKQPEYLFALLRTNLFRVGQKRKASGSTATADTQRIQDSFDALTERMQTILACEYSQMDMLQEFLTHGVQEFNIAQDAVTEYLGKQTAVQYSPLYPDSLGDDPCQSLIRIIDGSLAHYGAKAPYLESWDALCRETGNQGNATPLPKLIHDLFAMTQPWENEQGIRREAYLANFEQLFGEIAEAYCRGQLTLDKLYESLKLRIMTHEKKNAAVISRNQTAVPCMTVHKAKGGQWRTVFLFVGNAFDNTGNNRNDFRIRRHPQGRYTVDMQLVLDRIGSKPLTLTSEGYSSAAEQAEEWRVLYVALTRAKNHLFVSYFKKSKNPWNTVLEHLTKEGEAHGKCKD